MSIVDRAGNGQAVDTGVPPVASPSGKLLAAADLGEVGLSARSTPSPCGGIEPDRVRQLAQHAEVPPAYDWRIEGWRGETCVELSSVAWETCCRRNRARPRERFRARDGDGWRDRAGPLRATT